MPELKPALLGNLARHELSSYLQQRGRLAAPTLGPAKKKDKRVLEESREEESVVVDTQPLARSIGEAQRLQGRIFSLSLVLLLALFGLQFGVVLHGLISGAPQVWALSSTLMIWPAFWWARRLWLDRALLELVQHLLTELPSENAVEVLRLIYWGPLRPRK